MALGHVAEAIKGFGRVCALAPEHYEAHRALGFLWLSIGERGRALDHFARTYELRRGEDRSGIAAKSLNTTTRDKLAARRRAVPLSVAAAPRWLAVRDAGAKLRRGGAGGHRRRRSRFLLGSATCWARITTPRSTSAPRPKLPAARVSERPDCHALTRNISERTARSISTIFLTPPALLGLQRYLLESTIWHDFSHIGGFVASYLEDGLACPLLLQIADEMRSAFPELLGRCIRSSQAWVFKGLRASRRGRRPRRRCRGQPQFLGHARPRPTCDPERGGLAICLVPPPADVGDQGLRRRPGAHCSIFGTKRRRPSGRPLSRKPRRLVQVPFVSLFRRAGILH